MPVDLGRGVLSTHTFFPTAAPCPCLCRFFGVHSGVARHQLYVHLTLLPSVGSAAKTILRKGGQNGRKWCYLRVFGGLPQKIWLRNLNLLGLGLFLHIFGCSQVLLAVGWHPPPGPPMYTTTIMPMADTRMNETSPKHWHNLYRVSLPSQSSMCCPV